MAGARIAAYAVDTAAVSLSTTYAKATLDGTDEAAAVDFPTQVVLGLAQVTLDTIVTAASITWYVSEDAAGDMPLTPETTTTIVGQTAATGGIAASINQPWVVNEVAGKLYIWMKTDAGTASTVRAKLSFNTPQSR